MDVGTIVLNMSYVALLASSFTRSIEHLRALLIVAAVFFITFGLVEGIPSMVIWNIAIGGMHVTRMVRDHLAREKVTLSLNEMELRDRFFPELSDFDFNLLWKLGAERTFDQRWLIAKGQVPEMVALVIDGELDIVRDEEVVRVLRPGALVGEMSFVSGQPSAVDVVVSDHVVVREWDQQQLRCLDQLHPAAAKAFGRYVADNLAAKARF